MRVLPYLPDERRPRNDAGIRAVVVGRAAGALARAVPEDAAFAPRDTAPALREGGAAPAYLRAIRGGLSSRLWLRRSTTVPGIRFSVPKGARGASLRQPVARPRVATGELFKVERTPPAIAMTVVPGKIRAPAFEATCPGLRTIGEPRLGPCGCAPLGSCAGHPPGLTVHARLVKGRDLGASHPGGCHSIAPWPGLARTRSNRLLKKQFDAGILVD
ncbi:hypothetical protein B5V46_06915 [Rhodovulum sp. MB263]|nr:hypothetical protein B5V46_06915 [Rhodovulum sp. MB263]